MSDGVNKVILVGNLGDDAEMRFTANGKAITNLRVASSRSYGRGEERREETTWMTVVAWDKLAEFLGQYATKGRKVYVEGRLQNRSWDGPDGQKRYATEVVADNVLLLDRNNMPAQPSPEEGYMDPDELPFE